MLDIQFGLINGIGFGIEFPPLMEIDSDVTFCMAIDIGIIRIMIINWNREE